MHTTYNRSTTNCILDRVWICDMMWKDGGQNITSAKINMFYLLPARRYYPSVRVLQAETKRLYTDRTTCT